MCTAGSGAPATTCRSAARSLPTWRSAATPYGTWSTGGQAPGAGEPATFDDIAAGIDLLAELPVATTRVAAIGHSAGGHLAAWADGRAGLPPGAPGARPLVTVSAVVSQAGVLALADCAREGVGGTAALDLMGGRPQDLPQRYRLADPMTAVPIEAAVLCLHSRADGAVPLAYSERYVAAATLAGGRARLHETDGDHFTLIDPHSADWRVAANALPGLLGLPGGHLGPGRGETGEDLMPRGGNSIDK